MTNIRQKAIWAGMAALLLPAAFIYLFNCSRAPVGNTAGETGSLALGNIHWNTYQFGLAKTGASLPFNDSGNVLSQIAESVRVAVTGPDIVPEVAISFPYSAHSGSITGVPTGTSRVATVCLVDKNGATLQSLTISDLTISSGSNSIADAQMPAGGPAYGSAVVKTVLEGFDSLAEVTVNVIRVGAADSVFWTATLAAGTDSIYITGLDFSVNYRIEMTQGNLHTSWPITPVAANPAVAHVFSAVTFVISGSVQCAQPYVLNVTARPKGAEAVAPDLGTDSTGIISFQSTPSVQVTQANYQVTVPGAGEYWLYAWVGMIGYASAPGGLKVAQAFTVAAGTNNKNITVTAGAPTGISGTISLLDNTAATFHVRLVQKTGSIPPFPVPSNGPIIAGGFDGTSPVASQAYNVDVTTAGNYWLIAWANDTTFATAQPLLRMLDSVTVGVTTSTHNIVITNTLPAAGDYWLAAWADAADFESALANKKSIFPKTVVGDDIPPM
jgi:hypothetical protein